MKLADSSLDMCLKRDAAADAKKQRKDRRERGRMEETEGGKRKDRSTVRWTQSRQKKKRGQAAEVQQLKKRLEFMIDVTSTDRVISAGQWPVKQTNPKTPLQQYMLR